MRQTRLTEATETITKVHESIGGRRVVPVIHTQDASDIGAEAAGSMGAPPAPPPLCVVGGVQGNLPFRYVYERLYPRGGTSPVFRRVNDPFGFSCEKGEKQAAGLFIEV